LVGQLGRRKTGKTTQYQSQLGIDRWKEEETSTPSMVFHDGCGWLGHSKLPVLTTPASLGKLRLVLQYGKVGFVAGNLSVG
jgi:hypothetical protein